MFSSLSQTLCCAPLQIVLSSVHAVKGLECVVCFVVGLDQKAWRFRSDPQVPADVQQVRPISRKLSGPALHSLSQHEQQACALRWCNGLVTC